MFTRLFHYRSFLDGYRCWPSDRQIGDSSKKVTPLLTYRAEMFFLFQFWFPPSQYLIIAISITPGSGDSLSFEGWHYWLAVQQNRTSIWIEQQSLCTVNIQIHEFRLQLQLTKLCNAPHFMTGCNFIQREDGSTTVSLTFGDGTMEYVAITRSGYSSRIFEIRRVPCKTNWGWYKIKTLPLDSKKQNIKQIPFSYFIYVCMQIIAGSLPLVLFLIWDEVRKSCGWEGVQYGTIIL